MADQEQEQEQAPSQPAVLSIAGQNQAAQQQQVQQMAADEAAAATANLDETVAGGAYKVGDRWLNANGVPVDDPTGGDAGGRRRGRGH